MKKNILNIIFALIIVVVGPNVYADGTKGNKEKENRKEKAVKVVDRVSEKIDNELRLENWMTEVSEFDAEEEMVEENLYLEDWMMKVFEIEDTEADMELENWMLEPFDVKNVESDSFQEEELVLEDWMLKF